MPKGFFKILPRLQNLLHFFTYKSTRYGANLSLIILLVLGSLVFINYFAVEHDYRWDITARGINTLSPQTAKILKELPQKIRFSYFGNSRQFPEKKMRAQKILKAYGNETKLLEIEFIEVNQRPTYAKALGVTEYNTTVMSFVSSEKQKRVKVTGLSEEKLTNGIIRLLKNKDQVVYFTVGHGERNLGNEKSAESISLLRTLMEREAYTVRTLNLLQSDIPKDASVVIITGPQSGFLPLEIQRIQKWLASGGRLILGLDVDVKLSGLPPGAKQMAKFLKANYGVGVGNELLIDEASKQAKLQGQMIIGSAYSKDHLITKDFARTEVKFQQVANFIFPLTTYLIKNKKEKVKVSILARSTPSTWAEKNWNDLRKGLAQYNKGTDKKEQRNLALAIETGPEEKPARIVVFPTTAFIVNGLISMASNKDLFMNSLAWLSDQNSFISIRSKGATDTNLELNPDWTRAFFWIVVIFLPIAIFSIGMWVWKVSRSR